MSRFRYFDGHRTRSEDAERLLTRLDECGALILPGPVDWSEWAFDPDRFTETVLLVRTAFLAHRLDSEHCIELFDRFLNHVGPTWWFNRPPPLTLTEA